MKINSVSKTTKNIYKNKKKKINHMKNVKNIKKIKHIKNKNIMSSSLKSIYNKTQSKQLDAIKKRKTVKKNKNLFLNKKYSKKHKKTQQLGSGVFTQIFGSYIAKEIDKYKSETKTIKKNLLSLIKEFKIIYKLYEQKQISFNNNYLKKFKNDIDLFLDGIINKDFKVDTVNKKNKEGFKLMKKRMDMLNKIYRFSTGMGQTFGSFSTKNVNITGYNLLKIKGYDFNISLNQPKNFYYKHRHKRGTRFVKTNNNSKILRNFSINNSIWGHMGVYREYEMKLEKLNAEIQIFAIKFKNETETIINTVKTELSNKSKKTVKDSENIDLITKDEKTSFLEIEKILKAEYDIYNNNTKDTIHYYIPKIKVKNINLILIKLPRKNTIMKQIKNLNPVKSNIEIDEQKVYDTSDENKVNLHKKANDALFKKSNQIINMVIKDINEILNNDKSKYMSNFVIFNNIHEIFHNMGILYVYNLEKKPYIDIGQLSMLSYENEIDASLLDIKKKEKLIYANNMDYYNNILHLPRFILNHLNACMIKSAQTTYEDKYYSITGANDSEKIKELNDERLLKILENFNETKFKLNKLGLKEEEGEEILSLKEELEKQKESEIKKLSFDDDNKNSSSIDNDETLFLPISTYHAMFKIKDFNSIQKIKYTSGYNPFSKSIKINNEKIENDKAISRFFYINRNEDILPGTLIFLYKQIGYLLHFTLSLSSSSKNVLYKTFLEKILNFSYNDAIDESEYSIDDNEGYKAQTAKYLDRNIKRNIGIFSGIDNRNLYITYVMIVYLQHLNRLLECTTDLEYLTDKLFHIYKKDTNAIKIFRDEIDRISKQEDYNVDSKKAKEDKKSYGYDDRLASNEQDENINEKFEYKPLIYKIKKTVDRRKTIEEIHSLIQAITKKKQSSNIKPRLTLSDYYELTRKGDKIDLNNNIYKLYLNNDKVKDIDSVYFKNDLIEKFLFLEPNSKEIGGHSNEVLKSVLERKKEENMSKINTIESELYYLLFLLMDKHKGKNEKNEIKIFMDSIKKSDSEAIENIKKIMTFYIKNHIKIKIDKLDKNLELEKIYNNISKTKEDEKPLDMIDYKIILMNEFNLLHKDNFIFFSNKMYEEKEFMLTSLLSLLLSYKKEYPYTSALEKKINDCKQLLLSMKKKDEEIKKIVINAIKNNIIGTSKFLLVNYNKGRNPNIDFNTKNDPINEKESTFIKEWSRQKTFPLNDDLEINQSGSTITYIDKDELTETTLDNIPEIILGHNAFKDKILEYKQNELETLLKDKEKDIKEFNENILLVSFFKILMNKLLNNDVGDNKTQVGEHSSVNPFHKRSDIYYPIQFIFLNSEELYKEENNNYLQYSSYDDDFKDNDKIPDLIKEILTNIRNKYQKETNTDENTVQGIKSEDDVLYGDEKRGEEENFKNITLGILNYIKDNPIFSKLYAMKKELESLKKEIENYKTASNDNKKTIIEQIKIKKENLNKYYKLTLNNNEEYALDIKTDTSEIDIENQNKNIITFDFNKIIDGFSKISISLNTLDKDNKEFAINYNTSLLNIINKTISKTNDDDDNNDDDDDDDDYKINLEKSGELINSIFNLYKELTKVSIKKITTYWQSFKNIRFITDYFKSGISFDALNNENQKLLNKLILISINGYLTNDNYIKQRLRNVEGLNDKEISSETFIPSLVNDLKNKSVDDFINSSNVMVNKFKNQITFVCEKNGESSLGKNFNTKIDSIIRQILTKIKDNFILVNKLTLEKANEAKIESTA